MGGFSVVVILIMTFIIIAGVLLTLAYIGLECFVGAITSVIVLVVKRNKINKEEKWMISIPIFMCLVVLLIFFLFILFFAVNGNVLF